MTKYSVLFLIPLIIITGCRRTQTAHLRNVKFKIVEEATGRPLPTTELNICRFVDFKLQAEGQEPYLTKNENWFLTSARTDENGIFSLNLSRMKDTDIVVAPPEPYIYTRFELNNDITDTNALGHVRVVRFEPGSTSVTANLIYNLKTKIVRIIPISGEKAQQEPFEEILLSVKKKQAQENTG